MSNVYLAIQQILFNKESFEVIVIMWKKYGKWIKSKGEKFTSLSDLIWTFAETGLQEYKSSKLISEELEAAGFEVTLGIKDLETAIVASYGNEKPVIGILGEYDALPGMSQAKEPFRKPLKEGAPGHGCGHNLLGIGSLAAVLAVKEAIDAGEVRGTIRYYGCPAEESFNSKGYMIDPGHVFEDVDICLTWHPCYLNAVMLSSTLALNSVIFRFHGRTAHAAADPFNGRSALDAVELMNVGANYMREHIIPDARIHYVITNGGSAPNVVPEEAEVYYFVRAPERHQVEEIYNRLVKIAEGATLMTETTFEINFLGGLYNPIHNVVVCKNLHENMQKVGAPRFNKEEQEYAHKLKETLPSNAVDGIMSLVPEKFKAMATQVFSQSLFPVIMADFDKNKVAPGSTDVGDVTWVTPLGQFVMTCYVIGALGHTWQNVATTGMSIGHKGMLAAAKVLAYSALDFMNDPELVKKAREEFEIDMKGKSYKSPFPEGYKIPRHRITNEKFATQA